MFKMRSLVWFSRKKVGVRQVEDLTMCETHCAVHGGAVGGTV